MARSRSGQDLYGNAFRSVLWLIISMLPAPVSSVPTTDEHNREREEREGDSNPLATPEGTPGDRNASQGLVAAAQDQQQQGVHNNNSFSLSSSGRTTPAEAVIDTPVPPLPAPTGAPAKSTQVGGRTEGGQPAESHRATNSPVLSPEPVPGLWSGAPPQLIPRSEPRARRARVLAARRAAQGRTFENDETWRRQGSW